jgi:hypothetical protein
LPQREDGGAVKVLFVMWHPGFVRNYESVLRRLAAGGHQVHIAAELIGRNKYREGAFGEQLARETPAITMGEAAAPESTFWSQALSGSRLLIDYLRYLDPRLAGATALRARASWNLPPSLQPLVTLFDRLGPWAAARMIGLLSFADRVAPLSQAVTTFLRERRPDVVLVTPLIEPGSFGVDYVKCARALGIPTALCVASWDNLTNKGSIRIIPDRVFVWNAVQQREASELHGVDPARIEITGAQLFDHWFDFRPSRTRETFCATVGLDPARPFVLYLGSSFFIAPDEAVFGQRWIAALRGADDPVVAGAGILIRPHPGSGRQWHGADVSMWPNTAIWPPSGVDWAHPDFKEDFFDSLYHCSAVMGVNTSAQIEAAIVGKAVCTVEAPDFAHSQGGTLHFRHLVDGGLLHVARSLDEHVAQLGVILRDPEGQAARSARFIESFVHPHGWSTPATPILTDAVLALAASRPVPVRPGAGTAMARALLAPLAWLVVWLPERRPWWSYLFLKPALWIGMQLWFVRYRLHELRDPTLLGVKRLRRAGRLGWRAVSDFATRGAPRALNRQVKQIRLAARAVSRAVVTQSTLMSRAVRRGARRMVKQGRAVPKSISRMARRAAAFMSR